jgi:5-methylcytosine-specific restriction endonuclease McrA
MPADYRRYPKQWREISQKARRLAGNRCELCSAPNLTFVVRDSSTLHPWRYAVHQVPAAGRTKIVLTVHHIDGNPANNSRHNLIALCQRCHLRLDRERHIKTRKARRIGGLQQEIFG